MFRSEAGMGKIVALLVVALAAVSIGCRQKMAEQPYYDPYEQTDFFADGSSARQPVEGTVARGHLWVDDHLYTGKVGGELVRTYPFPINEDVLERGRERYEIFCTPCHGGSGRGNGVVVRRGFRPPPSFLDPKFDDIAVGHYIDVMTNGFGAMPSYAAQVPPEDRWAIAAYVEALRLSQSVTIDQLPPDRQSELRSMNQ